MLTAKDKKDFKKVAFVRYVGLGDLLMLTPIIREYKKQNPTHSITVISDWVDVLKNNPYIDLLIKRRDLKDSLWSQFDEIFNFNMLPELNPDKFAIQLYADSVGLELDDYKREVFFGIGHSLPLKVIRANLGRYAIFHTSKVWHLRQWSKEYYSELAKLVTQELNLNVIEIGDVNAKSTPSIIYNSFTDNVLFNAELIENAEFFVGSDSGCSHLAMATDTLAFVIYSVSRPESRITKADYVVPIVPKVRCRFCAERIKLLSDNNYRQICKKFKCMDSIKPKQIFEIIKANYMF